MGWLWILLGGFWSLVVLVAVLTSNPSEEDIAWWENAIMDILGVAVFVSSTACVLALLRKWRWSRPITWILRGIWLVFIVWVIWGGLAPRENTISDVLEAAVFVGSAVCGVALLRKWHWSRPITWIFGGIWLVFSILYIWGADAPLAARVLCGGPSLALAVYSFIVLAFVKHQMVRV